MTQDLVAEQGSLRGLTAPRRKGPPPARSPALPHPAAQKPYSSPGPAPVGRSADGR